MALTFATCATALSSVQDPMPEPKTPLWRSLRVAVARATGVTTTTTTATATTTTTTITTTTTPTAATTTTTATATANATTTATATTSTTITTMRTTSSAGYAAVGDHGCQVLISSPLLIDRLICRPG